MKIAISETGDVDNVEVVSGNPRLAQAASDAAKQWKFKPYLQSGKPVEVETGIMFGHSSPSTTVSAESASTD